MQRSMDEMDGPEYPMPAGGRVPDLNLAGVNGWNSVGARLIAPVQPMPTQPKPMPKEYTVHGSPEMGGIDPDNTIPSLNLAGVEGVPPPDVVARGSLERTVHGPDFGVPDMAVPALKAYDLTGPGMTYMPEWSADPANPDLSEYRHPYGLDIQGNDVLTVDPQTGRDESCPYEAPTGLSINRSPMMPDPLVPDLQGAMNRAPTAVHMSTRPGDLDGSALGVMDQTATGTTVAQKQYPDVQMDQSGLNTTRSRRMTLLYGGLHDEEHQ